MIIAKRLANKRRGLRRIGFGTDGGAARALGRLTSTRSAKRGVKTILTFHFAKELVSGTNETLIVDARKYSSSILTMMRRVGDCPGQTPGKPL